MEKSTEGGIGWRVLSRGAASWQRWMDSIGVVASFARDGWRRPSSRKTLQALRGRLEDGRTVLEQITADVESQFLAVGGEVQKLATLSRRLLAQGERLNGAVGAACGDHLRDTLKVIRQQLDFVEQSQATNQRVAERLEGFAGEVRRLDGCAAELDRILLPLRTTGILFKINSVTLGNADREFFAGLTQSVDSMQTQARAAFASQLRDLEGIHRTLDKVVPQLKAHAQAQELQMVEKRSRIETLLATLEKESGQVHARHERLVQAGKQVSSATGRAVVGLQYQDITRQKWEHVADAVWGLQGRLAAAPGGKTGRLSQPELAFLREASRLQARQLQEIQADLAQAQSTIRQSLHEILEHLKAMDAECQQMCGDGAGASAVEAMAQGLLDTLAEARAWVVDLVATAQTTRDTVGSLDKTVCDTTGTLRRLAADINLSAINAQVQVARLGEDTGLAVLSEHTRSVARAIREFSETAGAGFDALVRELRDTACECRTVREQAQTEQQWLQGQGHQQEAQVISCRDNVLAVLREVNGSLQETHRQAMAALKSADFQEASNEGFQQFQVTLEECARFADRFVKSESAMAGAARELETLKQRYTMESERAAHAATTATVVSASVPANLPPASPPGDRPVESVVAVLETASLDDAPQVELVAETTPTPPREPALATSASAKSDFGANVELF